MTTLRRSLCAALVLAGLLAARAASGAPLEGSVELHAHLFVERGLGTLFRGGFDEPLSADSWDDRLSSKVNARSLEASGAAVVVVALFAHPVFVADVRASVREQIAAAERFAARHPRWAIARSAAEAKRLLEEGKRILVLSLEGASGVLESEEDLREFIDERAIRIVTPLHLVDDRYGGAALLAGEEMVGNPLSFIDQLLDPHCAGGVTASRRGLTPLGRRLVVELVRRGVWIDLTHASDAALDELVPLLARADQPPLVTHTTLRRHQPVERAMSERLLAEIARRQGIVGLLPSAHAMGALEVACPEDCEPDACRRGAHAFAALHREVARRIGADAVMLGADWSGGVRHLPASCKTGTSLDRPAGLYHMGQERELWTALRRLGAPVPPPGRTVERFLSTWARVRRVDLRAGALPPLPVREETTGPSLALRAGAGMGSAGAAPGIMAQAGWLVRKDLGVRTEADPTIYFGRVEGDLTVGLEPSADIVHARLSLAPLGISAELHDNRALAEGAPVRIARHLPLDQAFVVQPSLLRGLARTMPGLGKQPGRHALFVELEADVLGSKHLFHASDAPPLHALHFAGAGLALGGRAYFEPGTYLLIEGRVFFDANLVLPAAVAQSDGELTGRFALGFVEQGVEAFAQASWLANLEDPPAGVMLTTMRYLGGVLVRLF